MDTPNKKEDIKPEQITALELNIIFHMDTGVVDVKGSMIGNEPISIWALDKAKDLVKAWHFNKQQQARQEHKIIGANVFQKFIRKGR
jgi:hypothetical protein